MSDQRHTPGRWHRPRRLTTLTPDHPDARLIAAAPCLLRACLAALAFHAGETHTPKEAR